MLRTLRVAKFALIDELELEFEAGLNVVTGETGAGKSILMAALELAVGGKAETHVVRTGEDEAAIEALFAIASPPTRDALAAAGIDSPENELLVRRVVSRSGRNRLHLNGSVATVGLLDGIGERLLRVYGQHEHHTLRQAETHLGLLDGFADDGALLARMRERHAAFHDLDARIRRLTEGKEVARARAELLRFQAREIAEASLRLGEDEELQSQRRILGAAEKLSEGAHFGEEVLYAGEHAAAGAIKKVANRLRDLVPIDARLEEITKLADDAAALAEEAGWRLREYAESVTVDPDRLETIEQRLVLIDKLRRKYGGSVEAILAHQAQAERELADLDLGAEGLEKLETERAAAEKSARAAAAELAKARRAAAARMETRLARELGELGMKDARFEVRFEERELSAEGTDAVEFFFSANPGEEARPLRRVASGGELSRIMLALKSVALDEAEAPTVIFDEVDAGIGGAVAEVVGRKLASIARERQVLCITHLPQIAAFADHHFVVSKQTAKGRTRSETRRLREGERADEVARMLGGVDVSAEARRHAEKLLASARALPGGKR
jgi:DNA repair protein RecN (Recombination protein N)